MNAAVIASETVTTMRMRHARSIEDTTRLPIVADGSGAESAAISAPPTHAPRHATSSVEQPNVRPAAIAVQDVFERTEKKYLITPEQYSALMAITREKLRFDTYGKSLISSLYFDTESDEMVNRSLEKPLYKEKIRVRAYGEVGPTDRVFVEMKKKFKGIVYKRRFGCSLQAARAYMDGMAYVDAVERFPLADEQAQLECMSAKSLQIANEIDACKARHPGLRPRTMIVTNRMALVTNDGTNVRITFDIDPVYRNDELNFDAGYRGDLLHSDGALIMEIKCLGAYPLWLAHALTDARIFPQSSTKIGRAYQLSHPTRLADVSAESVSWCAPEPKKNLMARLSFAPFAGHANGRKKGASCA